MASTNQVNVINNSSPNQWRRYSAYQDSGVEWLGEIPGHWEVKKVKHLCQVKRGASPRPIDDPIYFDDEGEYSWVRISDVTASNKYLNTTEQKLSELGRSKSVSLEPGELFLSIAATVGKPIITSIKCCIHDGFVYFPNLKQNREYLFYIFSGGELYKGLGKTGTQLNLNTYTVGEIKIPIPPLPEQKAIASFLDEKTARIDDLVEKKERLLELLKEKRTALISHAVTKGLDPSVAMKDSGIEWLGEIPRHWEVRKLNSIVSIILSGVDKKTKEDEHEVLLCNYVDVYYNDFISSKIDFLKATATQNEIRRCSVEIDDVLITKDSETPDDIAVPALVVEKADNLLCGYHLSILRPFPAKIDGLYLLFAIKSLGVKAQFSMSAQGITRFGITYNSIKNVNIPIPPLPEQKAIASFLDQETLKLDNLIKKIRESIATQKEYRTALISAAVTGKIDVR